MFTGKPIVNLIIGLLASIGLIVVIGTGAMVAMHAGMMHGTWSCGNVMQLHPGI
jgi:hypothetical protein